MQTDPISYAGGPNLYTYVANDPVNAVDPWGLCGLAKNGTLVVCGLQNGALPNGPIGLGSFGGALGGGGPLGGRELSNAPDEVVRDDLNDATTVAVIGFRPTRPGLGNTEAALAANSFHCALIQAGNLAVDASVFLGDAVTYAAAGAVIVTGVLIGGPAIAAAFTAGVAVAGVAGAFGVASGVSLAAGGLLQGAGGAGWDNAVSGGAALAFGGAFGQLARPYGSRMALSVRERHVQQFSQNGTAIAGGGVDSVLGLLPSPNRYGC